MNKQACPPICSCQCEACLSIDWPCCGLNKTKMRDEPSRPQHTITITMVVETTPDYGNHQPWERVQALLDFGSIREAFSDAGMTIKSATASENERLSLSRIGEGQ
jgi:hypothetical protein